MLRLLKRKSATDRVAESREKKEFHDSCIESGNGRARRIELSIVPFHIATGLIRASKDIYYCGMDENSIYFFSLKPVLINRYSKLFVKYKNVPVGEVCGICFLAEDDVESQRPKYGVYIDWEATSLLENGLSEYDFNLLGIMIENRLLRIKESVAAVSH